MATLIRGFRAGALRSPPIRVAASGGLLLAILWGILTWDSQRHANEALSDNRREVESVTRVGAEALLFTVRSIDLVLLDLREHWQLDRANFDRKVRLRQAESRIGIPFAIGVIGPDGRVAYSSVNPAAIGVDLSDRPYVSSYRDDDAYGELTVTGPIEGRLSGRRTLQFARPLRNREGGYAGSIVFSVAPDYFVEVVRSGHFQENTLVTVIRDDGSILAHTFTRADPAPGAARPSDDSRPAASAPPPAFTPVSWRVPSESGFSRLRSPVDQIERLFSWQRLAPYPLTLIVGEQASLIDDEISRLRMRYLVVGVIGSLLLPAALYGRLLTRRSRERAALRQREHLAQLTRSAAELRASRQQMRELAAHQMVLKEEERKRIAQEIHDELGQQLTVLRMDISMLPRAVRADPAGLLPAHVAALKTSLDGIMALVRDIAGKLRPAALDIGLEAAVEGLVEDFRAGLGIPCELDNRLPPALGLDERLVTAAFRIIQESLTNVARHADASRARVSLAIDGERLRVQVHDDGRGLDLQSGPSNPSFGLSGMRERAAMLGGSVEITSNPGAGTTVDARIPLDVLAPSGATRAENVRSDGVPGP